MTTKAKTMRALGRLQRTVLGRGGVTLALTLTACGGDRGSTKVDSPAVEAAPLPSASAPPQHQEASRAPFTLTLRGPERLVPGTEIDVSIVLERRVVDSTPLTVSAELPAELHYVRGLGGVLAPSAGTASATLPTEQVVDSRSRILTRTLRLRVDGKPSRPLVVRCAARWGAAMGARAERQLDWGPVTPTAAAATGSASQLGGVSLGTPVKID